jgi:hypothetical protein
MAATNVQAFPGDVTITSNLAVSGSKFTYDNTKTTVFTGTSDANASEIGYLDMSTSSSTNNIHVKIFMILGTGAEPSEAEYSFYIRPSGASSSLIYDYRNRYNTMTPVVYRTDANDLHAGGTSGVVRFGYSTASNQNLVWRVEVVQRSGDAIFYPTNTGSAVVTTNLVQVTPAPFTRFDSNVAVGGSDLFVDTVGGAVGIGTTSPGTALEVFSTSGTQMTLRSDSRYSTIFAVDDTGSCFFGNDRGAIRFSPGGDTSGSGSSEKMRILAAGNVGIGTDSPVQKLHLYDTTTEPTIAIQHLSANENNSSTNILGNLCLHRSHRSGVGNQVGIRSIRRANTHDDQADMEFYVRNGGNGEQTAMVINSGGDSNSAKVGIGTNNPQEALHVAGSMRLGAAEGVDDDNLRSIVTTSPLEIHSNAEDLDGLGVSLNLRSGFSDSESNIQMISSKSNTTFQYISFATATTERMRITTAGNVGIGVTNPGTRFAVQSGGDTKLRITSATTGNSVLEMGDTDDYDAGRIDYDNNNNWMSIYTAGGNRMRIDSNGYMTIGAYVQSPRFTLDIPAHYSPDTLGLVIHGGSGAANVAGDGGIGFNGWYAKQGCKVGIINHAVSWGRGNLHFCNKNTVSSGAQGDRVAYADSSMVVAYQGYVGIGTNNPVSKFNVWQAADNSPGHSFITHAANSTFGYWGQYISAGNDYMFHRNGSDRGYFSGNANAYQIDFTGQHRSFIDGISVTNYADFEGLVVSANKNKYYDIDENVTTGANAIQISQSLPLVALSNVAHDKACFGVISGVEDPDTRKYEQGTFVSLFQKQKGDTRAFINSLGEGAIWVTNIGGNLEAGDYITTSNVAGYGQKQDSEFLANYTVAKITMDCDFEPVTQPIQIIRKEMGDANYWVKTTYETISEEEYSNLIEENRRTVTETVYTNENNEISVGEYSNLESNIQSTYSELTQTLYQNITKEESKTEREGYELEVRQELVNVLDEHGQIQWEDHATETEKAYKIRYLDANGVITDEANAVHTAAFVGCTYHCG